MPEISYPPTKSRFLFFHLLAPLLSKEPFLDASAALERYGKTRTSHTDCAYRQQGQTP